MHNSALLEPLVTFFISYHFPLCSHQSSQTSLLAAPWIYQASSHLRLFVLVLPSSQNILPPATFMTCFPISLGLSDVTFLVKATLDTPCVFLLCIFPCNSNVWQFTYFTTSFHSCKLHESKICLPSAYNSACTFFPLSFSTVQY